MGVIHDAIEALKPYLEPGGPNDQGEWGMICPIHEDTKRSASLNVEEGVWFCEACSIGGPVLELIKVKDQWTNHPDQSGSRPRSNGSEPDSTVAAEISEEQIRNWMKNLLTDEDRLEEFKERRGINESTIRRFQIGYDYKQHAFTIPIRDVQGYVTNVRRYQLDPTDDRRKIWGIKGMGTPTLYPIEMLEEEELIICEGEWDALLLIQNGFAAITRTGAADVWKTYWNPKFDGKIVHLCHDMDLKGQKANVKVGNSLKGIAAQVSTILLPYEVDPKHGKDITDFFLDGNTPLDLYYLFQFEMPEEGEAPGQAEEVQLGDISVLDSFASENVGQELKMRVTITGKRNPPYLVPKEIDYSCDQSAGVKCAFCPMNEYDGTASRTVDPRDPRILEMVNSTNVQLKEILRNVIGAQKCDRLDREVVSSQSVEEIYVRPSVDVHNDAGSGDYTNRKIISVGRHDSLPNSTVEVVGAIYPNPRGQQNEFQAWDVHKTETSIDKYEVTPAGLERLQVFVPAPGQSPLQKLEEIADDLSRHVTKIYGRPEMHMLFDLVFHSILSFEFMGQQEHRGWLDALVVGDTRTGKSKAAAAMCEHYGAGEIISCEAATFAGIVGGLQQYGGGKEWEVSWGAIPLNDRRLVALDEISGLQTEQIGQMSSIRSSGEAQLTKIRSERTWARTRLLWMGNPRGARLGDYTYGIYAIPGLIGNNEDVARFDLAMSVATDEVEAGEINRAHDEAARPSYNRVQLRELLLWAWSRGPDCVVWAPGAVEDILDAAIDLGERYVEVPPLVQSANVRVKIARIAVALAARTFSTDEGHENVVVTVQHVNDAVEFMDRLYGMQGFGYKAHSEEVLGDIREAAAAYDDAKVYIGNNPQLAKFLRTSQGHFRRQDLEDMLNLSKEVATATVNELWRMRMITREQANVKINPLLHKILREVPKNDNR